MRLTFSHNTALSAIRTLRARGIDIRNLDHTTIAHPSPWIGKRWSMREFLSDVWKWEMPHTKQPLNIVVKDSRDRVRLAGVQNHLCSIDLPANSIIWLDEFAATSSPELAFVQMAELLSLPELVLLGYELCGHFARNADDPRNGPIEDSLRVATTISDLDRFVSSVNRLSGIAMARKAIEYIGNHAASAPEAVLAAVYALPRKEFGYGMGPVSLNQRVDVFGANQESAHTRYPDLMFCFGPLGINYEGESHLDTSGLIRAAQQAVMESDLTKIDQAQEALSHKEAAVRAKYVDDILRTRQLATSGRLVLPMTKEDLYGKDSLDNFTRQLLCCAKEIFGIDTKQYEKALNDTALCQERYEMLLSMLSFGASATS